MIVQDSYLQKFAWKEQHLNLLRFIFQNSTVQMGSLTCDIC